MGLAALEEVEHCQSWRNWCIHKRFFCARQFQSDCICFLQGDKVFDIAPLVGVVLECLALECSLHVSSAACTVDTQNRTPRRIQPKLSPPSEHAKFVEPWASQHEAASSRLHYVSSLVYCQSMTTDAAAIFSRPVVDLPVGCDPVDKLQPQLHIERGKAEKSKIHV